MKRSTFLSLLSSIGMQPSAFNYGAFALPPDRQADTNPEMPDGYQSLPDGSRVMWGTNPAGRLVQFPICAALVVNDIFIAKEDENPCRLGAVPMLTGFHLPDGLGERVGWMALVDWELFNPAAPYLRQK